MENIDPAEKSEAEIKLNEMTDGNRIVIVRNEGRILTLEKTGENENQRFILAWGLEGDRHPAGREGFIAILSTRLAVEQVLNHKPPRSRGKKAELEQISAFDATRRAVYFRHLVEKLIGKILKAQEQRRHGIYTRKS